MSSRVFSFLFVCIVLVNMNNFVMAKESWTITQRLGSDAATDEFFSTRAINYAVTERATSIETDTEVVFIDYRSMHLYRLDHKSQWCEAFSFDGGAESTPDTIFAGQTRKLMAEIAVKDTEEHQQINGRLCLKKNVLLGAGMLRLKTVAPITIEWFGQSFHEATGEYWVNSSITSWPLLQEKIEHRQKAFSIAPLLKRIDPLGIMASLKGIPFQSSEKSRGQVVDSVLTSGPVSDASSLMLPAECRRQVSDGKE